MTTTALDEFLSEHLLDYDRDREIYPYSLPQAAREFASVSSLTSAVSTSGSNFFSPETMKWWGSRVAGDLSGGRFFLTSEKGPEPGERSYSVRWVYEYSDSTVLQVGRLDTFFGTLSAARKAARTLANLIAQEA